MPRELILPLSILMGFIAYSLIAKWYVMPSLQTLPRAKALTPLLLFHSTRFIGLAFLIPGVTAQPLANLALLAILALRRGWSAATPIVWIFNIEGSLDLLNAVTQGLRYTQDGDLGATYFIPAVIVPALLVSHVMIFILLTRRVQQA